MFPDAEIQDECFKRYMALERAYTASKAIDTDKVDMGLPGGKLYPFQAAGVRYIEGKGGRAILADEMGWERRFRCWRTSTGISPNERLWWSSLWRRSNNISLIW